MSAASSEERQDSWGPLADPSAVEGSTEAGAPVAAEAQPPAVEAEAADAVAQTAPPDAVVVEGDAQGQGPAGARAPRRSRKPRTEAAAGASADAGQTAVWTSEAVGPVCAVKLPFFEGPLDLLLHLIRANEVDIEDIPIARISEQYLAYLDLLRELDIDVAAEYLLMAATLAHIKSRELLPPDAQAQESEEGEDPRAELARRLAAFAAFKEAARELDRRPLLGRDVFTGQPDRSHIAAREPVLEVNLGELLGAVRRVLASLAESSYHQVHIEGFTVQQAMVGVLDALAAAAGRVLPFEDLLRLGRSRRSVIATFLALLELAKIQAVRLLQSRGERGDPGGPIHVRLAVTEEAGAQVPAAASPELENPERERVQPSPQP